MMSSLRFTSVLAACAVLAACDASSSSREITGPSKTPALFDEAAAADNGLGLTPEGPFDQVFATEDPSAQQAATGGQALGHIGFAFDPPALGIIIDEKYEFAALTIEPQPPFTAKGELEVHLQSVNVQNTVHSDVICMTVVGNRARIAARVELLFINGVPVPPGELYNVWTVVDNGEGMETDMGSLMFFTPSLATALFHCNTGFGLALFPNQEGNVQVSLP
jgi:hypothetical protein